MESAVRNGMKDESCSWSMDSLRLVNQPGLKAERVQSPPRHLPRRRVSVRRIIGQVRSVFLFLFGATVLVCALANHNRLQDAVVSKVSRTLAASRPSHDSGGIAQNAIRGENEVDDIAK
jgi:hypothetical protein